MANELYRVSFKAEPIMVYADDPTQAINKARKVAGATVRPASTDEMLEWMSIELKKMVVEVKKIEKEFGATDCE